MKRLLSVVVLITGLVIHTNSLCIPQDHFEVSFSSPYPSSPFKKIKMLATQLWSEVNASLEDQSIRDRLEHTITDFAHAVLDLNTLSDVLITDVSHQMSGMSRRYDGQDMCHILEELQYLSGLIKSLDETFDRTMQGHMSDQAACVKVVLDRIQKKMERTLNASAP